MKSLWQLNRLPCVLAFFLCFSFGAAADLVPVVKTKTETFHNVELISKTPTHVFLKHARGVANVRVETLDAASLAELGLGDGATLVAPEANTEAEGSPMPGSHSAPGWQAKWQGLALPANFIVIFIAVAAVIWLFFSYCAMLICKKVGQEPGILVWIPVVQMVPLMQAAGMSVWWVVAMFVPVVGLVAQVLWCINIAKARGKGLLTVIFLILPFTAPFALMYLAFSAAAESDEPVAPGRVLKLDPLPVSQ